MYNTILLTLDNSPADRPIIDHIKELAHIMESRVVVLHVATGAAAQYHQEDTAGKEAGESREFLDRIKSEFESAGITTTAELCFGDPVQQIVKWVDKKGCDLVAMGTHGHRLLGDLILGATASRVQHNISVPVLLLRVR